MPSKPTWPAWYIDDALALLWSGLSGAQTVERLKELHPDVPGGHQNASVRTVLAWKERWPDDGSGTWSIADNQGIDPALVLPVLARVITESNGRRLFLTRDEARYITRIRQAAADLDLWRVWRLARRCSSAKAAGRTTPEVDAYLAFAPWRGNPTPYGMAVAEGWIEGIGFDTYVMAGAASGSGAAHGATALTKDGTR